MADLNHFAEQQNDFGADQEVAAVLGDRCLGARDRAFHIDLMTFEHRYN